MWAGKAGGWAAQQGARPPAAKAGGAAGSTVMFNVSTMSKKDDIGIETLVGDYAEKGMNHNRKYYQKVQLIPGHEEIKVFLYYWDNRDGAEFSGWWFGNELGGSQVWARCSAHGPTPPKSGWRIPWDAPKVEPGLLVVNPTGAAAGAAGATGSGPTAAAGAATPSAGSGPAQQRARVAMEKVKTLEASSGEILRGAKIKLAPGNTTPDSAQEAQDALQAVFTELVDLQKSLTEDITEARKGGPSAMNAVTELSKLSPRIRTMTAAVTSELNKAKAFLAKAQAEGQRSMAMQAEQQASEDRDSKALQEQLPEAQEQVTTAEDTVEAVGIMAQPLLTDPPEDLEGPVVKKQLDDVESMYLDAQNKITEARAKINVKLQGARKFAPDTRKVALSEYSALTHKLTEAQKKLVAYKNFKKDFMGRITAKKQLSDVLEKLSNAELEAEKAEMMSAPAEQGQLDEDEVKLLEETATPAHTSINTILRLIEGKLRAAQGPMKDELAALKERADAANTKLQTVTKRIKKQKESFAAQKMLIVALEKVDKAEETLHKCQDAEMPFLKGIEVLPAEESSSAITACEVAAKEGETIIAAARTFVHAKLAETKKLSQDLAKGIVEELTSLKERIDKAAQKLTKFKKETTDRKTNAILSEVVEAVTNAEAKVAALKEVVAPLNADDLSAISAEELKEVSEKAGSAEKEATTACSDARKVHTEKLKVTTRGGDCFAELSKLQTRLTSAQGDIARHKKMALTATKLVKSKEVSAEEEKTMAKVEADVNRADEMVKAAGDNKLTSKDIKEIEEIVANSDKSLKATSRTLETHLPGALPAAKAVLQDLLKRGKTASVTLAAIKTATKEQREKVLVETYIEDGQKMVASLNSEVEKMNHAELPFLKGIEVLPLQEASDTLAKSEAAIKSVQEKINSTRTFIASKNLELRQYDKEVVKPATEAFAKASEEINGAAQQLSQFKKDTEGRKAGVQMQEATDKVEKIEEQVKELVDSMKEVAEKKKAEKDPDELSPEFSELCLALMTKEKAASAAVAAARTLLLTAQRNARDNAPMKESLQKLQTRISQSNVEISKANKAVAEYEKKLAAKKLIAEVTAMIEEAQETAKKTTEQCASLVEDGAVEFLVYTNMDMLATAVEAHTTSKEQSVDEYFKEVSKGDSMSKASFLEYLAGLSEAIDREELAFSEERREAIFKKLDADGDGAISLEEFKKIFTQVFVCVKDVTMTDNAEMTKGKAVQKLKTGMEIHTVGLPKPDSKNIMRVECKLKDGTAAGWVSLKNDKGVPFCERQTAFSDHVTELEKVVNEAHAAVAKTSAFIKGKLSSAGASMAQARGELVKLQPKAQQCVSSVEKLKKSLSTARKDFAKREQEERNAHILAKERQAADEVLAKVTPIIEAMDACMAELKLAADPLTMDERCEKLRAVAAEKIVEARTSLREQQKAAAGTMNSAMTEVKRAMAKMASKVEQSDKACKVTMEKVKKLCRTIVETRAREAAAALRKHVIAKEITPEQLFDQLAKGEDRISEDSFCAFLGTVDGLSFKPEHARLLCRHVDAGGIGRRRFLGFVQQYFVVLKDIAITPCLEISKGKSVRKAEADEILLVLEGPCEDEKLGVARIRGRMLRDGLEGWISLKGNQGTPFLEEVEKPYFSCAVDVRMDKECGNVEGQEAIRTLEQDEIIELVEGPRKEVFPDGMRIRGKAVKDGAAGWIFSKDKAGVVFAEATENYFQCMQTVAMTDARDIKECNVVRKLAVGELILVTEGPEDVDGGVMRCKGTAIKDKLEGWITTKGNAGSVYLEKNTKYYKVVQAAALKKKFASDSAETVRELEEGEAFQVLEGPKPESIPPEQRIKGRAMSDQATGWITLTKSCLKPWSPFYKCVKECAVHDGRDAEAAKELRKLSPGETVEMLEGPAKEGKELRIKARADKDGLTGWVTVRNGDGEELLSN